MPGQKCTMWGNGARSWSILLKALHFCPCREWLVGSCRGLVALPQISAVSRIIIPHDELNYQDRNHHLQAEKHALSSTEQPKCTAELWLPTAANLAASHFRGTVVVAPSTHPLASPLTWLGLASWLLLTVFFFLCQLAPGGVEVLLLLASMGGDKQRL